MRHQLIHGPSSSGGSRDGSQHAQGQEVKTWAVILDTGDEVTECLLDFARQEHLTGAHLTAIGAFERTVLGYFDWEAKEYRHIPVEEQCEVVSLIGDVASSDGEPKLHMHVVLGKSDGNAMGGHLLEGYVRPTLEVIITESPTHLYRHHDAESGLALVRLPA